jgi:hypothetical protein
MENSKVPGSNRPPQTTHIIGVVTLVVKLLKLCPYYSS